MIWKLIVLVNMITVPVPEEQWASSALYEESRRGAEFKSIEGCAEVAKQVRLSSGDDGRVVALCVALQKK